MSICSKNFRPSLEQLETRFSPASIASTPDFSWAPKPLDMVVFQNPSQKPGDRASTSRLDLPVPGDMRASTSRLDVPVPGDMRASTSRLDLPVPGDMRASTPRLDVPVPGDMRASSRQVSPPVSGEMRARLIDHLMAPCQNTDLLISGDIHLAH